MFVLIHIYYCDMKKFEHLFEECVSLLPEKRRQKAVLVIQKKYGKNAILKGMNFREGATTRQRNAQVGGHKA